MYKFIHVLDSQFVNGLYLNFVFAYKITCNEVMKLKGFGNSYDQLYSTATTKIHSLIDLISWISKLVLD